MHGYNELKRVGLEAFLDRGWVRPRAWAVLVGMFPTRAAYSYLKRLHRFGLLQRQRNAHGLVLYRLSERGQARLAWLRRGERP